MANGKRSTPGVRAVGPGVWELVADAGRDPVTGRRRRVTRRFHGTKADAKKARAQLVVEVGQGRHSGTDATVDDLCRDWLRELERKGRKPSTVHNYGRVYRHDIQPTLGRVKVRKVTTKMLTDLYGAHQERGASAHKVYQIHATISSMMTQACRWGWRDSNPAQWAEPPPRADRLPIVPTPDEIRRLIDVASASKRPEYARAFLLAATTGIRRGELCGLRLAAVDLDEGLVLVERSITQLSGEPIQEGPTKNRRRRLLAIGDRTLKLVEAQRDMMVSRAVECGTELAVNAFVFSDAADGSEPWKPDAVTQYFGRLRDRAEIRSEVQFKHLRRFMETYGQDLGFSLAQVAIRAGHDPAVASKHYTGRVADSDRALASAIENLL